MLKISIVFLSVLLFANCAKKSASLASKTDKDKPKESAPQNLDEANGMKVLEGTPPLRDESATNTDTATSIPDSKATPSFPSTTTAPSIDGAIGSTASTAVTAGPPTTSASVPPEADPNPVPVEDTLEDTKVTLTECLLQRVNDLVILIKTENRDLSNELLLWVIVRAKHECKQPNLKDSQILAAMEQTLKETASSVFPEDADKINSFSIWTKPKAEKKEKILRTTEYAFENLFQEGTRDFRQPENASNYSIGKVQKNIRATEGAGSSHVPPKDKIINKDTWFSTIIEYSFGLIPKDDQIYTATMKAGDAEFELDYKFLEGSAEALKKGESVKIALTTTAWEKVVNFEAEKILRRNYRNIPRSALKIEPFQSDKAATRTCSIVNSGPFSRTKITCIDPEFQIRFQTLDVQL